MNYSPKAFSESTIGAAIAILDGAAAENRGLTAEEGAKVDALKSAYGAATGRQPPISNTTLREWSRQPVPNGIDSVSLMSSNIASGMGRAPQPPSSVAMPSVLVDKAGNHLAAAFAGEDFAASVRHAAELRGDVSERDEKFNQFQDDGLTIGSYMRAILLGPGSNTERAALQESNAEGGGYLVPRFMAAEVIGKFLAANRVRQAGATVFEMQSSHHRFARITSLPTCSWTAERGPIGETEMGFGAVEFRAKDLWAVLKFSRNLAQDAPNINRMLERSLRDAFAAEVDRACLLGNGVLEPSGLASDAAIGEVAVGAPLTGYDEVIDGYRVLYDANVPDPTALIMANQQWEFFAKLKDGDGHPQPRPPAIGNLPFLATTKATAGTMHLGYWPDLYIGFRLELQIELLRELYAETGDYGLLCHLRMDCGTVRSESFVKLTGIT